jgi:hypothetical protein
MARASKRDSDTMYSPQKSRSQIRREMGAAVDLLAVDVRFGCRILEKLPSFAGDSNRFAIRHLYRMLLGTLDAVENLLTSGSGDEARVLLRKAVEIAAQMQYLALNKENALLGTAFMLEIFDEIVLEWGARTSKADVLAMPLFRQAARALEEARRKSRSRRVRWYSISNGPVRIRQLVNVTQNEVLLESWDDLSRSVHGSRVTETIEQRHAVLERGMANNSLMFAPLRTSAINTWPEILLRADLLWMLGTMAVLYWDEAFVPELLSFNRNTRMPRLKSFTTTDVEETDLLCTLERSVDGTRPLA